MADTRDANKIVKPGTPTTAWITPDGRYITTDKNEAAKNGATHQVSAALVTYADGRRQYIVFNGDDRSMAEGTYSPAGSELSKDPDVVKEWEKGATDRKPPGGKQFNRNPDGSIAEWNPDSDPPGYNIPRPDLSSATGANTKPLIGRVEGTPTGRKNPDGSDEYDNTKPIWVERDPTTNQQVGATKPLTQQQREQWEKDKNGGKTDAEMQAANEESSSQTAVTGRPGWVAITRKKGNDTKTVYRGPDGKEVESLPEEVKTGSKQFVHTDGKTYIEVTKVEGNVTSVYVTDTAGNRVTLPGKESKSITQKRAPNGQVYYEVSVEKDNTKTSYTSSDPEGATRIPPPGQSPMEGVRGVPSYTPDLTKPGAGLVDRQKQLDELMAAGKITWEQRQAILAEDIKTANVVAGEFNTASTLLREDYQQRTSQRAGDITQAGNRATLANTHHQNAVALIEKFSPYLGATPGDAGKLFLGMMASQLATATAYGGMRDVPREDMDPRLRQWAENTLGRSLAQTSVPPGPGEAAGPPVDPQAAEKAKSAAMAEAQRASGQPMPTPLFGPQPVTAPVQPYQPTPAVTQTDPQAMTPPSFIDNTVWRPTPAAVGMAPLDNQNMANGEALFGKTLPQPQSWRQDAQDQAFALTMPQPQAYGTGAGLFGGSLPPALTQPAGGMDFNLTPPQGGGMDPIEAEARRQLQAEGVLV